MAINPVNPTNFFALGGGVAGAGAGTVSKFGVPNTNGQSLGILMPKLKHRFRVLFTLPVFGGETYDLTRQVVTAGRPQQQYNNTPLHSYNNVVYIAQKPEWQPIEIVLRDDITNAATSVVSNQLQLQMNHYNQNAARAGSNYKFQILLQTLDGQMTADVNILEEWFLEGCYIESVQYDSLDYSSSEPVQITLSIRYDNATQGNEGGALPNNTIAPLASL